MKYWELKGTESTKSNWRVEKARVDNAAKFNQITLRWGQTLVCDFYSRLYIYIMMVDGIYTLENMVIKVLHPSSTDANPFYLSSTSSGLFQVEMTSR